MILLDTHVLLWLADGNQRLGRKCKAALDEALGRGDLFISAISFQEAGMLETAGRLDLQLTRETWRSQLLENGLKEVPVNGEIALLAAELADFKGDVIDRLITATAAHTGMHLCTADQQLLGWGLDVPCIDARK